MRAKPRHSSTDESGTTLSLSENPPNPPRDLLHSSLPAVRAVSADEDGLAEGDAATQEREGLVLCPVDEIWKPAAEDDQGVEEGSVRSHD